MRKRIAVRSLLAAASVAAVTAAAYGASINPATTGFAYLIVVLAVASAWGFIEALVASLLATLTFNFFFLPPTGTFTIADPKNWVALFSFLATALIAGRLSARAERRTQDALERQRDVERLYTFSRAILLATGAEPFVSLLVRRLVEIFELNGAVLYDGRGGEFYRAGPADMEALDDRLREAVRNGASYSEPERHWIVVAVRLGAQPIASLAIEGAPMPDSVLQGISNLIAIGLERANAQELAHEIEVARQTEQLRTTLIDAMAHEFKTPLTAVKAAITSLAGNAGAAPQASRELLDVASEEVAHLQQVIEDSIDVARLDTADIHAQLRPSDVEKVIRDAISPFRNQLEGRLELVCAKPLPHIALDSRLFTLAVRQLIDNALRYSPPGTPVRLREHADASGVTLELTNEGEGIPAGEQHRIFERFYRSPSVKHRIPGSGLGLSIASSIIRAHGGELNVDSHPGQTTFRITLPVRRAAGAE